MEKLCPSSSCFFLVPSMKEEGEEGRGEQLRLQHVLNFIEKKVKIIRPISMSQLKPLLALHLTPIKRLVLP